MCRECPSARLDAGHPRALDPALVEHLLQIKENDPDLSIRLIIDQVRDEGLIAANRHLPGSTVHRLFKQHGLSSRRPSDGPGGEDRRRFAYAHAGQLWMSDVMHGAPSPRRCHRWYCRGLSMPGIPLRCRMEGHTQRSALRYGIARTEAAVTCRTLAG